MTVNSTINIRISYYIVRSAKVALSNLSMKIVESEQRAPNGQHRSNIYQESVDVAGGNTSDNNLHRRFNRRVVWGGAEVRWLKYKSRWPPDQIKLADSVAQFARIDDDLELGNDVVWFRDV